MRMEANHLVAGVDEAGRGPLAGPVVAAAVILDPERPIRGLTDSKLLTAKVRARLYDEIKANALSYCIAEASVDEIETISILQASLLAMTRAVDGLSVVPGEVWVDGDHLPKLRMPAKAIIQGDLHHANISAASILAKVARDQIMVHYAAQYPGYGFENHKGYPTKEHLAAMRRFGVLSIHRKTYAPVRALCKSQEAYD